MFHQISLYSHQFFYSHLRSMKENIIRSQPLDKQQTIAHWFDNLMENVERNLSMKNRDKYVEKFFILSCDLILIPLYLCSISDSVKIYRFSVVMSMKRWNKPIWMHPIPHQHLVAVRSTTWLSHSSCVTLQFFRMIAFFPYEKKNKRKIVPCTQIIQINCISWLAELIIIKENKWATSTMPNDS